MSLKGLPKLDDGRLFEEINKVFEPHEELRTLKETIKNWEATLNRLTSQGMMNSPRTRAIADVINSFKYPKGRK